MITIQGAWNTILCYAEILDDTAREQLQRLADDPGFAGCRIRIMPDVHAGAGCTIGTTIALKDRAVPAMVGVDIGCGMLVTELDQKSLDLDRLDQLIRREIPSGPEIRETPHPLSGQLHLDQLICPVNQYRAERSLGTLGGGNHFIEVDRSADGRLWLVIHSGSRHLGIETAEWYQREGYETLAGRSRRQIQDLIQELKAQGRQQEIQGAIQERKNRTPEIPLELAWVEGQVYQDYLHDMALVQQYAVWNRQAMADIILEGMGLEAVSSFCTVHNYIDTDTGILRKGAVSARKDELLLIPVNMRDGSLLCRGLGNPDWNWSAPHGAGRLLSRSQARNTLSMEEFRASMEGIYTTCLEPSVLDESPMAYKSLDGLLRQLGPTAEVLERLVPIYNFKATA